MEAEKVEVAKIDASVDAALKRRGTEKSEVSAISANISAASPADEATKEEETEKGVKTKQTVIKLSFVLSCIKVAQKTVKIDG